MSSPEPHVDGPPLIECDLPLGRPGLTAHNRLELSGWAVSHKGIAGVVVQVADRTWNAAFGLDSPDVARRLGDFPGAARAGYRIEIDMADWAPGPHFVTVAAYDRAGGKSMVEGAVEIQPFASAADTAIASGDAEGDGDADGAAMTLTLDRPSATGGVCEVDGAFDVVGWVHAPDGIEAVVVTIDGVRQYEALQPVVRPDLVATLGREAAAEAGFALRVDPVDCPPGRHTLSVVALGRDGRRAGEERELLCRPDGDLAGAAVERLSDGAAPTQRDPGAESDAAASMWESRALLAEADAALARAEADVARTAQEATLRRLRAAEARLADRAAGRG